MDLVSFGIGGWIRRGRGVGWLTNGQEKIKLEYKYMRLSENYILLVLGKEKEGDD